MDKAEQDDEFLSGTAMVPGKFAVGDQRIVVGHIVELPTKGNNAVFKYTL